MDSMKGSQVLLDNGFSHYRIFDGKSIKVLANDGSGISTKAVTIMSKFQVELGRTVDDIIKTLSLVNIPVILEEYLKVGDNFKYYSVVRLRTGKVPEFTVCKLGFSNNILVEVIFDSKTIADRTARKYGCVSALASIAIVESGVSSIEMDAISTIMIITGSKAKDYKFTQMQNKISIETVYNDFSIVYTYIRNKEVTNKYNLLGVYYKKEAKG